MCVGLKINKQTNKQINKERKKCSEGKLYILQCQGRCLNINEEIIYKSCINYAKSICNGKEYCAYSFSDALTIKKNSQLKSNARKREDECLESDENEVISSTTCIINESFSLDELSTNYLFFLENENNDVIICKKGKINVLKSVSETPFCDRKSKNITDQVKKFCDNKKECILTPSQFLINKLKEREECYINTSYFSMSVVCLDEKETTGIELKKLVNSDTTWDNGKKSNNNNKDRSSICDVDVNVNTNDVTTTVDVSRNKSKHNNINNIDWILNIINSGSGNKDDIKDHNIVLYNDKKINDIFENNKGSIETKMTRAKDYILKKLKDELKKKNNIFENWGKELSQILNNKYKDADLKDLLEDRYNELKDFINEDVYYIYLVDTLNINEKKFLNVKKINNKLQNQLQNNLTKLKEIDTTISMLKNLFKFLCIELKQLNRNNVKYNEEEENQIIEDDSIAYRYDMISADIFFTYNPELKNIILLKTYNANSDNDKTEIKSNKGKITNEINKVSIYKDITESFRLDKLNMKKRVLDIKKTIIKKLQTLSEQKNLIFNIQASCIKLYCYKNLISIKKLSDHLKNVYYKLVKAEKGKTEKEVECISLVNNVVNFLNQYAKENKISWNKTDRIQKKLHHILQSGFEKINDLEIEIINLIRKLNVLREKAKENKLNINFEDIQYTQNGVLINGSMNGGLGRDIFSRIKKFIKSNEYNYKDGINIESKQNDYFFDDFDLDDDDEYDEDAYTFYEDIN
ncbi:surface protein P113 [Hepatocystis sp. ex Piliocolobus tephrosceles]|nr:surface protein P113 [Hepatocystis sp. ex Piliocolobus tephrosceles]